jgi:SAM-dependent methyltransferase
MAQAPSEAPFVHITLDPPYVLGGDQARFRLRGWCEVDDEARPDIEIRINGRPIAAALEPRPGVRKVFPGMQAMGVLTDVDFREVLAGADRLQDEGGFLLSVAVRSDRRRRAFEYAVTPAWLEAVFGEPLAPYPVPPAALQVRVTGAAAGGFVQGGRQVADEIAAVLAAHGVAVPEQGRVHDFGCGSARVLIPMALAYPHARFSGSDIDPEAIAWCRAALPNLAECFVNAALPPLPFADDHLDLIYSISIFTHLPEQMQDAWLAELRRVLKPGGYLLTTKVNPFAYGLPEPLQAEARARGLLYTPDSVATEGLPDFYRLAYHTTDYIRRIWGQHFEVLHIGTHDINTSQDAVLLRKR